MFKNLSLCLARDPLSLCYSISGEKKFVMEESTVKSGIYCLEIQSFSNQSVSLVRSLLDQCARQACNRTIVQLELYQPLCQLILESLQRLGCYCNHVPAFVQHPKVFRDLARVLKYAITIYYSDGYKRTHPFLYRVGEPTLQLYSDRASYSSIHRVSLQKL